MNNRQKTFMKIAAIGSIIEAVIFSFIIAGILVFSSFVNETLVGSFLKITGFKETLGVFTFTNSNGSSIILSAADVSQLTLTIRGMLINSAISMAVISLVNLLISIVVLVFAKKEIDKKWPIIVGLIACIPASNWLCLAFYIVVLCLRHKSKTAPKLEEN